MPSYVPPKKNTEYIFYVSLVSQANTKLFQSNPTLAAGDVKVSTNGGAEANITTLPVVTPSGSKRVKVTLSASEMNGDNTSITFSDAAGSQWCDLTVNIQTSATQIDNLVRSTTPANTLDVDASGDVTAENMRGTDNAALASVCTEGRMSELDAANIPARTDGIQTDLDNATDGLGALKALIDTVNTDLSNGTDGLGALKALLDTLAARLTAARAGYLDNLNGHTAQTADHTAILAAIAGYLDTEIADIINHLTDIKGTSFVKDTHSLINILLDVTGINGDAMRGTDSAALASVCTEGRLSELDAANIPARTDGIQTDLDNATDGLGALKTLLDAILTDTGTSLPATLATIAGYLDTEIVAILADTNALQTDLADGGRLDLLIDAIKDATDLIAATPATESYAADGAEATLIQINYMILSFLTSLKFVGTTGTARKLDGSTPSMTFTLDDASNPTDINRAT